MKWLLALLISTAYSHSWYPQSCCSQTDCRPVPCHDIVEIDNGQWQYLPTLTKFPSYAVHPSQDRYCHVCISAHVQQGYCVFIQNGF